VLLIGLALTLAAGGADFGGGHEAAAATASYSSEVVGDGPLAYWRLGELSGTIAADQTGLFPGNYRNGVVLGRPGALIADANSAARFDGVNDHLAVPNASAFNTRSQFTLEAWVNVTALPTGKNLATIFSRAGQYSVRTNAAGALLFSVWRAGRERQAKTSNGLLPAGTWRHVVAVYNGSTLTVYVNATQRATGTQTGPLDSAGAPLYVGTNGSSAWLFGTVDEVAVYGSALSAARIARHYEAATVAPPPVDLTPPAVSLTAPAGGSTGSDPRPTLSGAAGSEPGDSDTVTVKLYAGQTATGTAVQTLTTSRSGSTWQTTPTDPLAAGTYTAQAEQSDTAGNTGSSQTTTFTIQAPPSLDYRAAVRADAPRGYWRLGESAGTAALDETGIHPGTYAGSPVLGRSGALAGDANAAARFDGVDDQVRVLSALTLNSSTGLALEAWLAPRDLPLGTATLVRKDGQYMLRLGADGRLTFRLWKGGSYTELNTPGGTVKAGDWQHVVATFDGATMTVYLNGIARATVALSGPSDVSTSSLYLGASGGYDWLNGALDEVAIYNAPLSTERVRAHYEAASNGDTTPPAVTLTQPTSGSTTTETAPAMSGAAGNSGGDSDVVTVKIYQGSTATGSPLQTSAVTRADGGWSALPNPGLAAGTYTVQAEQSDLAGNLGRSNSSTFTVDAPPPVSYRDVIMADAPRGYWRFGELSGTTAADQTGRHPGAYNPPPRLGLLGVVGGDPDTAADFDGFDDQVRVPHATTLNSASALSLEAWLKPTQLPVYSATVIRKDLHYMLRLTYSGALVLRLWKGGSYTELTTATGLVKAGIWQHVAATYDGSTMRIYLNGTERASRTLAGPVDTSSSALYIASAGGYDWVSGTLDEVAVYGSPLSVERVRAHYDRALQVDNTPPTIRVDTPAQDSTMNATPNFGGSAGTFQGDSSTVSLSIYSGTGVAGSPLHTITTTRRGSGTFSVLTSAPLPSGTYTVRAEQSDAAGNVGRSSPKTFSVDAGRPTEIVGAGDIAYCGSIGDEATANLLDKLPGVVLPLGDLAYERGTPAEFADCYDPSWGRHLARSRPIVGDHDYDTAGAAGYFGYVGSAFGSFNAGYYSYDLGDWHVVALDSVCYELGPCENQMEAWLEQDLAANPGSCTLALLHEPLFSSGAIHGNNPGMQYLWQIMYDADVDVVLSGSEHIYERFAPQTPTGAPDANRGIREFIVGTGGRSHYAIGTVKPNSQVRSSGTFGVMRMTLGSNGYTWQFVPEAGKTFSDSGTDSCH